MIRANSRRILPIRCTGSYPYILNSITQRQRQQQAASGVKWTPITELSIIVLSFCAKTWLLPS